MGRDSTVSPVRRRREISACKAFAASAGGSSPQTPSTRRLGGDHAAGIEREQDQERAQPRAGDLDRRPVFGPDGQGTEHRDTHSVDSAPWGRHGRLTLVTGPLVLLDSASLYFRSYYALPDSMTAPDGTVVNAVRGFTDTIARILTDRRPSRLVACMDADWRPAFRVNALPSYKAHRVADPVNNVEEVPDTLTPQVPIILDVLDAFGFAVAEADGYEADDVIGTLAHRETTDPVEVITGDRDLFQVVAYRTDTGERGVRRPRLGEGRGARPA